MRLLIASDGSPHSDVALQLGIQLLRRDQSAQPPTVVTVVKRESDRPQAKQTLAKALGLLGKKTNEVTTKIRIGRSAEEVVAETIEGKYNLVILGKSSEQSLITRWLGSTAVQVAERAPCTVAIATGVIKPIRQILVCDSGVHSPSLLNRFMQQLGDLLTGGVIITVLHVMSQMAAGPEVSGEQLRANTEELIRAHAPEGELLTQDIQVLQTANVQAVPKVRHGFVVDEILDEARRGDYDLVVIGAHEKARWTGFLLDDLAKQIITQIDRPVLLVR